MGKIKKESSTVAANLTGFQGNKGKARKTTIKAGKPFDEVVALAEALDKEVEEVVKKRGNQWVFYDDETDVQHAAFSDREKAWDVQRRHRQAKAVERKRESEKEKKKPTISHVAPVKQRATKKENIEKIKSILRESFMTYMFEQIPTSKDTAIWEKFLSRLSRETVMSDPKLKSILEKGIKSEVDILNKSVSEMKSILEKTKSFAVKEKGIVKDKDTSRVVVSFEVHMKGNNQNLPFSISVENGRPLVMIPDRSKEMLNQMANDESKLLRAELMHAQETVLDKMPDVIDVNEKRDKHLNAVQAKVEQSLEQLNLLEIAMLKYLMKTKLKGVG